MPNAARKVDLDLEESGLVRVAVFPNLIRDVRKEKGFTTLREFTNRNKSVNYTRLAKIERGEVVPVTDELSSIAKALKVPVGQLLINVCDPEFDREQWARDHIETKRSSARGGDFEAMIVGAAMRVCRHRKGLSASDLKLLGLPVATVSRIENAERPVERWEGNVQRAISRVLDCQGIRNTLAKAFEMYEDGELDQTLVDLFSPASIRDRNNKRLRALLSDFQDDPIALRILDALDPESRDTREAPAPESVISAIEMPVLGGSVNDDYWFGMGDTGRVVSVPENLAENSIAVEMGASVLGPGLPVGSVLILKKDSEINAGDVVALIDEEAQTVLILSAINDGQKLCGFQMLSSETYDLSNPGDFVLARMVTVIH